MTETSDRPRRRFVVGKVFFALLVVFLLASVTGRIWWGWHADRQYQAVIDDIRSRGEPVSWREMAPPPIPDDQNAVEVYKRIFAMPEYQKAIGLTVAPKSALTGARPGGPGKRPLGLSDLPPGLLPPPKSMPAPTPGVNAPPEAEDEWVLVDKPDNLIESGVGESLFGKLDDVEFIRKYPELTSKFYSLIQKPLAQLRQARGMKADFKLDYNGSVFTFMLPKMVDYIKLGQALRVAAMISHDRGDDAQALDYLRDGRTISEAMYSIPSIVGQMVGVVGDGVVASSVERIAPTLKIGAAPKAASPEQVRAMIAGLLEMRASQKNLARSCMAERSMGQDALKMILEDPMFIQRMQDSSEPQRKMPAPALWSFRFASGPMWTLQAAEHMRLMDAYVLQAKSRRYTPFNMPQLPWMNNPGILTLVSHCVSIVLTPTMSHVFDMQYRGVSNRRMTATALAIRLYECEHGKRPATLTELCPAYLPAVPEDPFDQAHKGIKYLPNAKHPILYVVGQDMKDDGGRYCLSSDKKRIDMDMLDMPFFLNGPEDQEHAISELSGTAATSQPVFPDGS